MSFYLRKTVRVGPLRLNLSKSGLGVSAGVPGFRVGAGPRGSYVRVGRGGIFYQATLGAAGGKSPTRGKLTNDSNAPSPSSNNGYSPGDVVLSDVTGATTTALIPSQLSELVMQLNDAATSHRIWPWLLVATILLSVVVSPLLLILGIPAVIWMWWRDKIRRTVVAFYEIDGHLQTRYQILVDAFTGICQSQRAWHVVAEGDVRSTHQYKINAGATSIIRRKPLNRGLKGPPHLSSNIAIPALRSTGRSVYFLPDRMLVRDRNTYADVAYAALDVDSSDERFIEDDSSDAPVVGRTWKYVNVKGGPDRRY